MDSWTDGQSDRRSDVCQKELSNRPSVQLSIFYGFNTVHSISFSRFPTASADSLV